MPYLTTVLYSCQRLLFVRGFEKFINGRESVQLFVGVFDTCLVWYLLVPPSEANAVANTISFRAINGDTSYHSHESFSLTILQPHNFRLVQNQIDPPPLTLG